MITYVYICHVSETNKWNLILCSSLVLRQSSLPMCSEPVDDGFKRTIQVQYTDAGRDESSHKQCYYTTRPDVDNAFGAGKNIDGYQSADSCTHSDEVELRSTDGKTFRHKSKRN